MGNVDPYLEPRRDATSNEEADATVCSQAAPIALEAFFACDSLNLAIAQSCKMISANALDWACPGVSLAVGAVWPMCKCALQLDTATYPHTTAGHSYGTVSPNRINFRNIEFLKPIFQKQMFANLIFQKKGWMANEMLIDFVKSPPVWVMRFHR